MATAVRVCWSGLRTVATGLNTPFTAAQLSTAAAPKLLGRCALFTAASVKSAQIGCPLLSCRTSKRLQSTAASPRPQQGGRVYEIVDNVAGRSIDLTWATGQTTAFPYVWLRDCCLCDKCHHPDSQMRTFSMAELDVNIVPTSVLNDTESEQVLVTWPDGHTSRFAHDWLAERVVTNAELRQRRQQQHRIQSLLWDRRKGEQNLLRVDYSQLMSELPVLQRVLKQLQTYGVLVITDSPKRFGVVEDVCNRLGHLRLTHYGKTFRVANKVRANNLAFTAGYLPVHLDLPYYHYVPGVQALHCISQHTGTGGDNILVDSFHVAEIIRKQKPALFHLLTTVPFEFNDVGEENDSFESCRFHKIQEHRMFKLDEEGNMQQACFHNPSRAYRLFDHPDTVKQLYEAMKLFYDLCMHEDNHFLYKMVDGDVIVFNNYRVMHGRLGYSVNSDCERTLEGGYTDWDEVLCRYRVVNAMINQEDDL